MRIFDDRITFWNQGSLPSGITPESLFQPHDSQPRNRLIANAFYMAGFIEAWGRGFEIISNAFKGEDLEVPTLVEEFGGVRVIIKREIFYAIQHGGRIDPQTGRLIKPGDKENDRSGQVAGSDHACRPFKYPDGYLRGKSVANRMSKNFFAQFFLKDAENVSRTLVI